MVNDDAQWTAVMAAMWAPLSARVTQAQAALAGQPKIRVATAGTPNGAADAAALAGNGRRGNGQASPRRKRAGGKAAPKRGRTASQRTPAMPARQACPACANPLVSRTGKFGPFVGCSGFPQCRYVAKSARGKHGAPGSDAV